MRLWIDDVRTAPLGWVWIKTVNEAVAYIQEYEDSIEIISLDHDAGDYAKWGGDYIKILDLLEENDMRYPIHIHSMNPVGVANMRAIIQKNGWREV